MRVNVPLSCVHAGMCVHPHTRMLTCAFTLSVTLCLLCCECAHTCARAMAPCGPVSGLAWPCRGSLCPALEEDPIFPGQHCREGTGRGQAAVDSVRTLPPGGCVGTLSALLHCWENPVAEPGAFLGTGTASRKALTTSICAFVDFGLQRPERAHACRQGIASTLHRLRGLGWGHPQQPSPGPEGAAAGPGTRCTWSACAGPALSSQRPEWPPLPK